MKAKAGSKAGSKGPAKGLAKGPAKGLAKSPPGHAGAEIVAARHLSVSAGADGQRLDNFLLARLKGLPKSMIHRLIRTGQVRVNGKRRTSDSRVDPGDDVRIPPLRGNAQSGNAQSGNAQARARPLAEGEIRVVHEDDAVLVIDKPAGLAVHGGSGIAAGLIERLPARTPTFSNWRTVWIVTRPVCSWSPRTGPRCSRSSPDGGRLGSQALPGGCRWALGTSWRDVAAVPVAATGNGRWRSEGQGRSERAGRRDGREARFAP